MFVTNIFLSRIFFIATIICLILSLYFKIIVIKTSPGNRDRNRIIGNMKDPMTWREKNTTLSYILIIWSIVSLCLFAYLKFFNAPKIISIVYLFIYLAAVTVSILYFVLRKKVVS